MLARSFQAGLPIRVENASPDERAIANEITEEAALTPAPGEELRVEVLANEGDTVAQGQPIIRLRKATDIALVAPMAARIASVQYRPGHRLVQMVLFRESGGDRHSHDTTGAESDPQRLRALLQKAGLWRVIRSRPFGHMPGPDEQPAAIFVMAADSRPGAPNPVLALKGREDSFARGLAAIATLTQGRTYLCAVPGVDLDGDAPRLTRVEVGRLHPMGLAGLNVLHLSPAAPDARVWDLHAEDVADIGELLATGHVPETRLVSVTGGALREARLVRCQPGADLRGLSQAWVKPGPHEVISGSVLDGHSAHWLAPRDHQVSILPAGARKPRRHWFSAALQRASRPLPIIPTAALNQSMGGVLPVAALVRALGAGNTEGSVALGALSLLEEDLALADYITAADPPLSQQLRVILDRVEQEEVAE